MTHSQQHNSTRNSKADQGSAPDRLSAFLRFDTSISCVKQVSPQRLSAFEALGVSTIRDLLTFYPRRYLDMAQLRTIVDARIGEQCSLFVRVHEVKKKNTRNPRLSLHEVTAVDETGTLIMAFFNQPWIAKQLDQGVLLRVSGKIEFSYGFKRLTNPLWEIVDNQETQQGLVLAIHPASSKLSRRVISRVIKNALDSVAGIYDPLPLFLREKYRLCSRYQAFRMIHFPLSMQEVTQAKRRLIYEELFFLELFLLGEQKKRVEAGPSFSQTISIELRNKIESLLPFSLTQDQSGAVDELLEGMKKPEPLRHLLLGDVGTGKTMVSLFGLVAACASGNQAVMIAPTEVLMWQYASSLGPFLEQLGYKWELLSSSTSKDARTSILAQTRTGDIQVLFGTHALLEDDVVFNRCSFVCIDEQQRFGVSQREKLISKAPGGDVLSMTATPIPRSYALTLYGDMTLSYLKQAPAKQKGRVTKVCHFSEEALAYDALRACIERGEQAFVICPLIGERVSKKTQENENSSAEQIEYASIEWGLESDLFSKNSAKEVFAHAEILKSQVVPAARVGVLHGKLSSEEKNEIMENFKTGEIDVLVSTTVIEVGIDVPRASVMIIEDADYFGLAQLHQLRGRVGRGNVQGEVYLVSRSKSPEALERLRAMEKTEDGFKLSEFDLLKRREGDVFGVRQHGRPSLKLVNVIRDKAIIERARADAQEFLQGKTGTNEERQIIFRELDVLKSRDW